MGWKNFKKWDVRRENAIGSRGDKSDDFSVIFGKNDFTTTVEEAEVCFLAGWIWPSFEKTLKHVGGDAVETISVSDH